MTRPIPALRRDIAAELLRAASLSAKARATIASLDENLSAENVGRVGNGGHDLMTLGNELSAAGQRIFDLNCQIADIEADRDHGPLLSTMRQIVLGNRPSLYLVD